MDDIIWIVIIAVLLIVLVVLSYATWRGNKCCSQEHIHRINAQNAMFKAESADKKYASQNRERNQFRFENDALLTQYNSLKERHEQLQLDQHRQQSRSNLVEDDYDTELP